MNHSRQKVRAVLFDWDGTLVDTAEASYRCYVRMFAEFGLEFDRNRYAETYSPDWHHTYRCMGISEEHYTKADQAWLRYFADEKPALVEGAIELLDAIAARGLLSALVTSASRGRMTRELVSLGMEHRFAHVICGDDGPRRKPHPEALNVCLERLAVTPQEAIYVGDSPEDMAMARAAGVFSVAVPGAYPNTAALAASGPDLMARDLGDAVEQILFLEQGAGSRR